MNKNLCEKAGLLGITEETYECGNCGNHVCKECAVKWSRVCPNCFGRLYRVS